MTHFIENARDWIESHGVLAQIKRSVHINNLHAEIEYLWRENEQLKKQVVHIAYEPDAENGDQV